jgi:hypothetical protein
MEGGEGLQDREKGGVRRKNKIKLTIVYETKLSNR